MDRDTKECAVLKYIRKISGSQEMLYIVGKNRFNIKNDIVVRRNAGKDNYSYYIYAKGED